ncbi:MAG: dienelactone hydrolase family protein [Deltaproteobacteria bacterium]|nr:dienelactone hydrolase family protein [Deltaproteobacteria bacterium]
MLLVLSFLLLGGCSATSSVSIPTNARNGALEPIPAAFFKPDGPGPFPAVVIMHDCSGLGPRSSGAPERWARELTGQGYVVLIPDSFTTRGHAGGVCTNPAPSRSEVSPYRRVGDAYAALAYLRTLPCVDKFRVGLMGGSHGGSTTLAAMVAADSDSTFLAREKRAGFAAAVALYPACNARYGGWRSRRDAVSRGAITDYIGAYQSVAPLLILIGENDDWTPAEPCRKLTEAARQAGYPVTIKIYPGAFHSFDSDKPIRYIGERVNVNSPTGRGATTGGDPKAWADSIREVIAFFEQHLRQKQD